MVTTIKLPKTAAEVLTHISRHILFRLSVVQGIKLSKHILIVRITNLRLLILLLSWSELLAGGRKGLILRHAHIRICLRHSKISL